MQANLEFKYNQSFKSKNINIRNADEISRRVHQEFPVYSNTALLRFKTRRKTEGTRNIYTYVALLVSSLRLHYDLLDNKKLRLFHLLSGMKTTRVGNCYEQSMATSVALNINGYKNASPYALYAYNPKKNKIIDLDHVVVGINIIPQKGYKKWNEVFSLNINNLIKPNNKSIIVDPWAGFTDDAKTALTKYRGINKQILDVHKLYLLPMDKVKLSNYDKKCIIKDYPHLLLSKNKKKIPNDSFVSIYNISQFPDSEIAEMKKLANLKSVSVVEKKSIWKKFLNKLVSILRFD